MYSSRSGRSSTLSYHTVNHIVEIRIFPGASLQDPGTRTVRMVATGLPSRWSGCESSSLLPSLAKMNVRLEDIDFPLINESIDLSDNDEDEEVLQLDPSILKHINDLTALQGERNRLLHDRSVLSEEERNEKPISVDEFKHIFSEDWQLSQFWL